MPALYVTSVRAVAIIASCISILSCSGDTTSESGAAQLVHLQFDATIGAQSSEPGRSVRARIGYDRQNGTRVSLAETLASVVSSATNIALDVNIAPCLADPARAITGAACSLRATLTLLAQNGAAIDSVETPPISAVPGSTPAVPPVALTPQPAKVEVTPTEVFMSLGEKATLTARVLASDNSVLTGQTVTWSSGQATVASVTDGLVTSVSIGGPVTITASVQTRQGTAKAFVGLPRLSCSVQSTLRSGDGSTATDMTFRNVSAQTLLIYWIDHAGQLVLYQTMPANTEYVQGTFLTHPWLVTTQANVCVGIWMAPTTAATAYIR